MKKLTQLLAQCSNLAAMLTKTQQAELVAFMQECLAENPPHPLKAVFDNINAKLDSPDSPVEFEIGDYYNGARIESVEWLFSSVGEAKQVLTVNSYGEKTDVTITHDDALNAVNTATYDARLRNLVSQALKIVHSKAFFDLTHAEQLRVRRLANGELCRTYRSVIEMTAPSWVRHEWPIERVDQCVTDDEEFLTRLKREYGV